MDLQYPIGIYEPKDFSAEQKERWLSDIKFLPNAIEAALINLDEQQLHTPYRPAAWTVHQLVHHVADSHMNAYIRFKLALTEDNPTIKPYEQDLWVKTSDVENLPVNVSVTLLHALHQRWHEFLKNFRDEDFNRTIYHPEYKENQTLWYLLGSYAWHGRHHVSHINGLRQRMGW